MKNASTPFTRWLGRALSPKEEGLVRRLEAQRCEQGYVRAIAHDPHGELTQVVCDYVSWIQACVDARDALAFTPLKARRLGITRLYQASARAFRKHQGKPLCIGQVVLFGSHAYCPSVPLYRSYFDQMLSLGRNYLALRGTVLIILGDADARGSRTPFARFFRTVQAGGFYTCFDATEEIAAPASDRSSELRIQRPQFVVRRCEPCITPSPVAFMPYRPRGTPIAA